MRTCLTGTEEVLQSRHSHNVPPPQQGIRNAQFALPVGHLSLVILAEGAPMKTKPWLLLLLALALALLAACGPRKNCAESYDDRKTNLARICTNKKEYDFGEPIYITFTVTNVSDEPLVLNGGEKAAIDIRVQGEHWSDGRELAPELTRVTLEPGESRTLEWVWPTARTDLEPLKRISGVYGIVRPLPGTRRAVSVDVRYQRQGLRR